MYLHPNDWTGCERNVPFYLTRSRYAPFLERMREATEARLAGRDRVMVHRVPCRGRVLLGCAHGPGCPGHMVRVLVKGARNG